MTFPYVSVNGKIIHTSEAQISLLHSVFLSSFGIYEAIQVEQGRPFHFKDHLHRLQFSAELIGLNLPSFETFFDWGGTLIKQLPAQSYTLQILVIGGSKTDPYADFIVAFLPKPSKTYPAEFYTLGAKAITFEGQRTLPQCKSFNTLVSHLSRGAAEKEGALEAILSHENKLFEGARSNVFVVKADNKHLLTPPASMVLAGITRDIVIDLMQDTPHPVEETDIFLNTPIAEMFITSTSMHVLPITTLNGHKVGDGTVGPITKLAMRRFETYYEAWRVRRGE